MPLMRTLTSHGSGVAVGVGTSVSVGSTVTVGSGVGVGVPGSGVGVSFGSGVAVGVGVLVAVGCGGNGVDVGTLDEPTSGMPGVWLCAHVFFAGVVLPKHQLGDALGAAGEPSGRCGFTRTSFQCQRVGLCCPPLIHDVKYGRTPR